MNVELLLKVKAAILEEPKAFDMIDWFRQSSAAPCGTTACIAGWAVVINEGCRRPGQVPSWLRGDTCQYSGEVALEIDDEQAMGLFYIGAWPRLFAERYKEARSLLDYAGMAKAAADRIDHFITTEGRE